MLASDDSDVSGTDGSSGIDGSAEGDFGSKGHSRSCGESDSRGTDGALTSGTGWLEATPGLKGQGNLILRK